MASVQRALVLVFIEHKSLVSKATVTLRQNAGQFGLGIVSAHGRRDLGSVVFFFRGGRLSWISLEK